MYCALEQKKNAAMSCFRTARELLKWKLEKVKSTGIQRCAFNVERVSRFHVYYKRASVRALNSSQFSIASVKFVLNSRVYIIYVSQIEDNYFIMKISRESESFGNSSV